MSADDAGQEDVGQEDVGQEIASALSEEEALARLRLSRTEQVGPATFRRLLARFGSAVAAVEALPDLAARGGRRRPLRVPTAGAVEAELAAGAAMGARLLHLGGPAYPTLLAEIDSAPPVLWALGDPARLGPRSVALVGTRNASTLGRRFAFSLARALAAEGLLVASGLARGVDAAAHAGALAAAPEDRRLGGTAAVLAGGVDQPYPPENADLYGEIAEAGVVLSEMPLGHQARAADFPRRNRIVSGLALGVVVIEGAERSGSLITAGMALDQGREVMAAPGHPSDARAAGCNRLIRDGAMLIRNAADVLQALGPMLDGAYPRPGRQGRLFEEPAPTTEAASPDLRDRLLDLLGPSMTPLDALVRDAEAPAGAVAAALLELELAGEVTRAPGGGVARTPPDD